MTKKSPYQSGELTDNIFLILLATLEPIHGYRMMQVIRDMTEGAVDIGPATMYTTLKKLSNAGWIFEVSEDDSKTLYKITDEGNRILKEDFFRRKNLAEIAEKHLKEREEL